MEQWKGNIFIYLHNYEVINLENIESDARWLPYHHLHQSIVNDDQTEVGGARPPAEVPLVSYLLIWHRNVSFSPSFLESSAGQYLVIIPVFVLVGKARFLFD